MRFIITCIFKVSGVNPAFLAHFVRRALLKIAIMYSPFLLVLK